MVRTLYKLSDLRETRFGQPPPRHGLSLLWWFAHDCVQIDSNARMIALCDPENGDFGFHRFYNRDRLLPWSGLLYYEVGNLNSNRSLPHYVTKSYTGQSDNSNKDRIIISFDSKRKKFENVYVTQHSDRTHFDQNHTYRISTDLLKDIQDLSREDFLREPSNHSEHIYIDIHQSVQRQTCPSTSNEPVKYIKQLNHEDFFREPMNCSEPVPIDVLQSVQGETCQSTDTLLIEETEESNCEEPMNRSEQLFTDIHQSAQRQTTWAKPSTLLRCALFTVILIAAITWYLK
ncbi:uncharacterized protein LOC132143250 [Carassius carassius]|uniref:uncharacterized protein LOC132143250 n=1 Tax=Carassius carassius TaxID=217509 RepID=UPI0028696F39|nr:uncharacterized protein LOC132143250 [Carassius carassius]